MRIENAPNNAPKDSSGKYVGWAGAISFISLSPFVGRFLLKLAFVPAAQPITHSDTTKDTPQQKTNLVECSGRYADVCSERNMLPGQAKVELSKEASIQCLAWGLLLNESSSEIDKQAAYLLSREKYFKRKISEIEQGLMLEEETNKLVVQAEKFDYQLRWFSEVSKRFAQMYDQHKVQCVDQPLNNLVSEADVNLEYDNKKQWLWR